MLAAKRLFCCERFLGWIQLRMLLDRLGTKETLKRTEMRSFSIVLCLLGMATLVGCGRSDGLVAIKGKVSFNGTPVTKGTVSFMPVDGNGKTTGAEVIDGTYEARVSPGEQAVQIYGFEVITKEKPTEEELARGLAEEEKQIIPVKYNRESELRVVVSADAAEHDFPLEGKPLN